MVEQKFTFLQCAVVFCVIGYLLKVLLRKNRFDPITRWAFMAALFCSFIQFYTTSIYQFRSDIYGHLGYIETIARQFELPFPSGWQNGQPPIYYTIAALFMDLGAMLGVSPNEAARVLSVLLYYGTMMFAALLLRRMIATPWIYRLCLLSVLFWPAGIHTGVKITNDVAESFFAAGFVYYLVVWLETLGSRSLAWAIAYAGVSMGVKGSGLFLLLTLFASVAYLRFKGVIALKPLVLQRGILIGLALGAICSGMNFGRTLYWREVRHVSVGWFINRDESSYAGTVEQVENRPYNYLSFDYRDFVGLPFERFENTAPEAHLFWNVLLKTLIFDEVRYYYAPGLAQLSSFLFLACLGCYFLLIYAGKGKLLVDRSLQAMMFMTGAGIVMVMCSRILIPVSHQATGRYIYVVVILFLACYGRLLSDSIAQKRHPWITGASLAALGLFLTVSTAFILAQFEWSNVFSALAAF